MSGYVADAGSLSKLHFAYFYVSAPEYVSVVSLSFFPFLCSASFLFSPLASRFPPSFSPVFFCCSSPSVPGFFPFCFSASPFLLLLLLLACQDVEHPGRAVMTHAHAVVLFRTQKASQHAQYISCLQKSDWSLSTRKKLFTASSLLPLHTELCITIASPFCRCTLS